MDKLILLLAILIGMGFGLFWVLVIIPDSFTRWNKERKVRKWNKKLERAKRKYLKNVESREREMWRVINNRMG